MITLIKVGDVVDTDHGYGYVIDVYGNVLDIALANNSNGYVIALADEVDSTGKSRRSLTAAQRAFLARS